MKSYTVKRIAHELNIDKHAASLIRRIVRQEINRQDIYTAYPETEQCAERDCYHSPSMHAIRMHAIDRIMGGHGVESIEKPDAHGDGRYSDFIDYVNTGDTYNVTILRDGGKYWIGTYGDTVEKLERTAPTC